MRGRAARPVGGGRNAQYAAAGSPPEMDRGDDRDGDPDTGDRPDAGPEERDGHGAGDGTAPAPSGDSDPERGSDPDGRSGPRPDLASLGARLRADARDHDHRRLVVLAGDRTAGREAAAGLLAGAGVPDDAVAAVATEPFGRYRTHEPANADRLLGTTRAAVVLDGHDRFDPNALGQVAGVADGGGLLVLVVPPLAEWPDRRDAFDAGLAVPPFEAADVTGRFRRRLIGTLDHPGVTIVDVDAGRIERDGSADAPEEPGGRAAGDPARGEPPVREPPAPPVEHAFPRAAYEACLTGDQVRAVRALERLGDPDEAVVVEADRGRGKSSAAGLAAGALAAAGRDVLVTAPERESARELFVRAESLLATLGALGGDGGVDRDHRRERDRLGDGRDGPVVTAGGGRVRFARPPNAADELDGGRPTRRGADPGAGPDRGDGPDGDGDGGPDVVLVDEAAAVPVRLLTRLLAAPSAGFVTTVHGYEGAGRGFAVRFREHLEAYRARGTVTEIRMDEPIRYARDDPVESWANRALLLDARPAVEPLVADAAPGDCTYRALPPEALLADEHLLREAFGLLVAAHYRTEPDDLARLLDAPNLRARALLADGHVVSVALLAREGGLDADTRRKTYDGGRIRGNMLPDVLTSQVRDEAAGEPVGYRVVRIATHAAVRSRGLGSRLLDAIEAEVRGVAGDGDGDAVTDADAAAGTDAAAAADTGGAATATDAAIVEADRGALEDVDYLGVAYGATPALVEFWDASGYDTVHLSTSRNATSGEYSALMVRPLSAAGRALRDRHAAWFLRRVDAQLADPLSDLDADVVRAALRAADADACPPVDVSEWGWRTVAGAAYGPGLYDVAPGAFRPPVVRALVEGLGASGDGDGDVRDRAHEADQPDDPDEETDRAGLDERQERLLVRKVLQARPWGEVAAELGFHSRSECLRAFGRACRPLVDAYGDAAALAERDRYTD